jgi:hypothetical protein
MLGALQVAGVVVGVAVASVVYVDASRQGFERARSLAAGVGVVSAAGFLAPALLFERVYAHPDAAGSAPLQVVGGAAATGVVATLAAVMVYGLASRLPEERVE